MLEIFFMRNVWFNMGKADILGASLSEQEKLPPKWKVNQRPRKKIKITEASHTRCNRLGS